MNDMSQVIIPRSDQLNSDDLLAGPRTITITRVVIKPGTEQPVSIFYKEDESKPYKACKSMCRVMVAMWGPDANNYVGRSMTLFCDPKVLWGGMAVGGIRISHMSHIAKDATMALTATKGSKKPFTVRPLATPASATAASDKQREGVDKMIARIAAADSQAALNAITQAQDVMEWRDRLAAKRPELEAEIKAAVSSAFARFLPKDDVPIDPASSPLDEDDFPGDRP